MRNRHEDITGVPTGFASLDRITYGWQTTDLIILAARPSVGKTAFALNLARNAALHASKPTPVAFFSLEMSSGQLVQRILSAESEIRSRKYPAARWKSTNAACTRRYSTFVERLIFIDDSAALNLSTPVIRR